MNAVPITTPVVHELIPSPDPWETARRFAHLPHLLFLDSADRHSPRSRYSYISADPVCFRQCRIHSEPANPFRGERELLNSFRTIPIEGLPPFQGGLVGVFGYGLGRAFEAIPASLVDEFQLPDLSTAAYDWLISFDHQQNRAWAISTGFPETRTSENLLRARQRLQSVLGVLESLVQSPLTPKSNPLQASALSRCYPLPGLPGVTSTFDQPGYEAAVRRVVEYLHAGDCFQVNLSHRLLAPLSSHPLDLYSRLRSLNPAPFAAYFDLGEFQILSASPERFLQVRDGEAETRPIKGTRPRGSTPEDDRKLRADLIDNPKDRAENVMIVDLLRNDLGRVCEYGSVTVPRICEIESFRFVHHLVSEVRGRLRPECDPLDLLAAAFPGGSVTGAPKVRAMQIIAELEPTARGPYCGSLGFIGFDGTMDSNLLIRTFTAARGWLQFPVGGGIVADSDPRKEYEETLHKAEGLLRALKE